MANEFVARNGLIAQNNSTVSGSLTVTGGIIGSIASASYASTASLAYAVTGGFSKSFAIINNTYIQSTDVGTFNAWRANTPCTASMILGYRDAGTGAAVSASRNGLPLVSSPLSLSTTNGWVSSSALQNQNFSSGDVLTFSLMNFTGSIADITMQVSFIY
jgi:hypothetical protein